MTMHALPRFEMSETPRFQIQRDFEPWQMAPELLGTWQLPAKVTYLIDGRKVPRDEYERRLRQARS